MNFRNVVFIGIALFAGHSMFAQDVEIQEQEAVSPDLEVSRPLYILKLNKETIEVDPRKYEPLDLESLNSRYIRSVSVVQPEESKKEYGEKGTKGTIIIEFKDGYIFAKESLLRLKPVN